jgi:hypothetical protein
MAKGSNRSIWVINKPKKPQVMIDEKYLDELNAKVLAK